MGHSENMVPLSRMVLMFRHSGCRYISWCKSIVNLNSDPYEQIEFCYDWMAVLTEPYFWMTMRLRSADFIGGSNENSGLLIYGCADLLILLITLMNHGGVPVV